MDASELKMSDWLRNILADDLKDPELVQEMIKHQRMVLSIMSPHVDALLKKNRYNVARTSDDLIKVLRKHKDYR